MTIKSQEKSNCLIKINLPFKSQRKNNCLIKINLLLSYNHINKTMNCLPKIWKYLKKANIKGSLQRNMWHKVHPNIGNVKL